MKFLKVLGGLMCFIGCLMALMGVLGTAVPMIDNDQVQNIVSSFSAEGGNALTGGVNAVVRYCLANNYLVFVVGMVLLLIGGLIKSRADKALFAMRFLGAPAGGDKAEARPETRTEAQPAIKAEAPAAPHVTAWADLRPAVVTAAPQVEMPPEAQVENPAAKTGFGRLFTAKRMKPAAEPAVTVPTAAEAAQERAPAPAVFSPHEVLFPSADKTPAEVAKSVEEIVYGAPEKEAPVYSFAAHTAAAKREPEPETVRAAAVAARERIEERIPEPVAEAPVYAAAQAAYRPPIGYDMPAAAVRAAAPEPLAFRLIEPEARPAAAPVTESWNPEGIGTIEPAATEPKAAEPVAMPEPVAVPATESWEAALPKAAEPVAEEPATAGYAAAPAAEPQRPVYAAAPEAPVSVPHAYAEPEPVWEAPVYTASIFRTAPKAESAYTAQPVNAAQPISVSSFVPQAETEPVAVAEPVARVTREPVPTTPKPDQVSVPMLAQVPMSKPIPASASQPPVYAAQPVPIPSFVPQAETEPAAVPVARVTREPAPAVPKPTQVSTPKPAQIPAQAPVQKPISTPVPRPAQIPVPMPAPAPAPQPPVYAARPVSIPSFVPQAEAEPAAVPVARVTREPVSVAPKPAQIPTQVSAQKLAPAPTPKPIPAPVPQPPVYTAQPAARPIPNEAPPARPAHQPAYAAAQPAYAQPAAAAYRRSGTAPVEWETKATANDRMIFATRQWPEAREETLTPPAPYRAPAAPPAPQPAQAAWTGAPEPVHAAPKYMRTPTMPGMPSADGWGRAPEPAAAPARAPEPAPYRAPAPPPPPSRVKIVSTMRAYPSQEAAYAPQPGYYDDTAPTPAYAEEPSRPVAAARPRIVSTMGKNRYPQP